MKVYNIKTVIKETTKTRTNIDDGSFASYMVLANHCDQAISKLKTAGDLIDVTRHKGLKIESHEKEIISEIELIGTVNIQ